MLYLPRFDSGPVVRRVEQWRPTMAFLVPAMVQLLLTHPRFASRRPVQPERAVDRLGAPGARPCTARWPSGCPAPMVTNNYSMTEAGTRLHLHAPGRDHPPARVGGHADAADRGPHRGRRRPGPAHRGDRRGAHRRRRAPPRVLPRSRGHRPHRGRAGGCAPATWVTSTRTATSTSWAGPRTSSSGAGTTSPPPRWRRALLRAPRACSRRPWWGSPTTCWARTWAPSWCPDRASTLTADELIAFCRRPAGRLQGAPPDRGGDRTAAQRHRQGGQGSAGLRHGGGPAERRVSRGAGVREDPAMTMTARDGRPGRAGT